MIQRDPKTGRFMKMEEAKKDYKVESSSTVAAAIGTALAAVTFVVILFGTYYLIEKYVL